MIGGKHRVVAAMAGFFLITLLGGCSIDVVQPAHAISAETLCPILGIIVRSAAEMGVPAVVFYAEEEGGIDVSMVGAARELSISEAVDGSSLHLIGEKLETIAKR